MNPKSITTKEFVAFIEQLSAKYGGAELILFMDNLRVHKAHEVVETCQRLNVKQIFNVPYSPDFNGIECYFSVLKAEYKKLLLHHLI